MRILSLNAWGGRIHDQLIPYLSETNPDVLCLQEVVRTPTATSEWLIYRDHGVGLPQRANLFDEVSAALPSHQAFFCPAARGDLYDGEDRFPSEWGLATFVRKSHPVIGQSQRFVHGEFLPGGWGAHPRSRNAHAVRLFDYDGSFAITIAQMHGLRDPAGKEDTPSRHAQTEAFIDLIDGTRQDGDKLVVCGDFNVLPTSTMFDALSR